MKSLKIFVEIRYCYDDLINENKNINSVQSSSGSENLSGKEKCTWVEEAMKDILKDQVYKKTFQLKTSVRKNKIKFCELYLGYIERLLLYFLQGGV